MSHCAKNLNWNSVDVRGADGLLHLGRAIDCASEGLMVDFMCGTAPQLVPFGKIYHSRVDLHTNRLAIARSQDLPVDVLTRLSSQEPAKWYPGILLLGHFSGRRSFAVVHARTPQGSLVEIVPVEHIRQIDNLPQFLLKKGQYAKEEVPLPSGVSSGSPSPGPYKTAPVDQHLVDTFNENCSGERMMATHIDGGVLHVVKVTDRYRWNFDREYRVHYPEVKKGQLLRMLGMNSSALRTANLTPQKRSSDGEDPPWKKTYTEAVSYAIQCQDLLIASRDLFSTCFLNRNLSFRAQLMKVLDDANTTKDSTPINHTLAEDMLAEIFSCIDGAVQVKLRRVCSRWNNIMNAYPLIRVVRLPEEQCSIVSPVCLLKRWTTQTKVIINTNLDTMRSRREEKGGYGSLMCSGRLFRLIMQEHQLSRLETLILADISWEWSSWTYSTSLFKPSGGFGRFISHICQELNLFASICRSLVLKDVTVALSGSMHQSSISDWRASELLETSVILHITKGRIEGELSVENLWNRMDSSLPQLTGADVDRWKKAIADSWGSHLPRRLVDILNVCQSADPRSNNHFRDKEWSRENLADLDLTKLNRITLYSLLKACSSEKLVFVVSW